MQKATLADLIFPIPRLISYISEFTALSSGDVIVTGTPGGVGDKGIHLYTWFQGILLKLISGY